MQLSELKNKSIRGGIFTLASQAAHVSIRLVSIVVLARLLTPDDFGIIVMALAITAFADLFRDLGLSSAAIQKKDLSHAEQSNLFWLNCGAGILLTLVVAAIAPLVAWFYGQPELTTVTLALSSTFFISSLSIQHNAHLMREMLFLRQAIAVSGSALVGLIVSILLALQGYAYWALVWGNISWIIASTILLITLSPFRPGWISRTTSIRDMLGFGFNLASYDLINYFHRKLDKVLIGKFWGAEPLGLYSRAYTLLMLPINSLMRPMTTVAFPAMSRLREQPEDYRNYFGRVVQVLALVSMPFTAFLCITAEPLIHLLLGPQWLGIVPIFVILAATSFIQPVVTLWELVATSMGMGSRYLQIGIFIAIASIIGFFAGLPWGSLGVATGYAIATYLTALPVLIWAFRATPIRLSLFCRNSFRPAIASLTAAFLAFYGIRYFAPTLAVVQILLGGAIFTTIYCLTLVILPGSRSDWHLLAALIKAKGLKGER